MSIRIPCINSPIRVQRSIPGSKSITNRALLLASLAQGKSLLQNVLFSDDSMTLMQALENLGVLIEVDEAKARVLVTGCSGKFPRSLAEIDCRDAGTVARFLLAVCANQSAEYRLDGSIRLRQRPLRELVDVLRAQGANISSNTLPLMINNSKKLYGGDIFIASDVSSQFLSGLLMISPYMQNPVLLKTKNLISKPYVDMTCAMMHDFGVNVVQHENTWQVLPQQYYQAREYWIEPDFSSASYFFAAAAISEGEITISNISYKNSIQGDKNFLDVLQNMGCIIREDAQGLTLIGPKKLKGVIVDMGDFSDTMMTLAAIAPFASSPTHIFNVANTRVKESDRLSVMTQNLRALGIRVDEEESALTIYPGLPRSGIIKTHRDHRIAMAFTLIGLKVPDIVIDDEECVSKTFPDFFQMILTM